MKAEIEALIAKLREQHERYRRMSVDGFVDPTLSMCADELSALLPPEPGGAPCPNPDAHLAGVWTQTELDAVKWRGHELAVKLGAIKCVDTPPPEPGGAEPPQDTVAQFIERCQEIRGGSPNAFYAHVDRFCQAWQASGAGAAPPPVQDDVFSGLRALAASSDKWQAQVQAVCRQLDKYPCFCGRHDASTEPSWKRAPAVSQGEPQEP